MSDLWFFNNCRSGSRNSFKTRIPDEDLHRPLCVGNPVHLLPWAHPMEHDQIWWRGRQDNGLQNLYEGMQKDVRRDWWSWQTLPRRFGRRSHGGWWAPRVCASPHLTSSSSTWWTQASFWSRWSVEVVRSKVIFHKHFFGCKQQQEQNRELLLAAARPEIRSHVENILFLLLQN